MEAIMEYHVRQVIGSCLSLDKGHRSLWAKQKQRNCFQRLPDGYVWHDVLAQGMHCAAPVPLNQQTSPAGGGVLCRVILTFIYVWNNTRSVTLDGIFLAQWRKAFSVRLSGRLLRDCLAALFCSGCPLVLSPWLPHPSLVSPFFCWSSPSLPLTPCLHGPSPLPCSLPQEPRTLCAQDRQEPITFTGIRIISCTRRINWHALCSLFYSGLPLLPLFTFLSLFQHIIYFKSVFISFHVKKKWY